MLTQICKGKTETAIIPSFSFILHVVNSSVFQNFIVAENHKYILFNSVVFKQLQRLCILDSNSTSGFKPRYQNYSLFSKQHTHIMFCIKRRHRSQSRLHTEQSLNSKVFSFLSVGQSKTLFGISLLKYTIVWLRSHISEEWATWLTLLNDVRFLSFFQPVTFTVKNVFLESPKNLTRIKNKQKNF